MKNLLPSRLLVTIALYEPPLPDNLRSRLQALLDSSDPDLWQQGVALERYFFFGTAPLKGAPAR